MTVLELRNHLDAMLETVPPDTPVLVSTDECDCPAAIEVDTIKLDERGFSAREGRETLVAIVGPA